jgi:hypothetical protein
MHGSVCLCTMWQRQAAFPDQSSAGVYYRKGEKLQQSPDLLLALRRNRVPVVVTEMGHGISW